MAYGILYDLFLAFLSDLITNYTIIVPLPISIFTIFTTFATFHLYWSSFSSLTMPGCSSPSCDLPRFPSDGWLLFLIHFSCHLPTIRKAPLHPLLRVFCPPTCLSLLSSPLPYFIFITLTLI